MKQQQLEKENAQLKSQIETQAASIRLLQEECRQIGSTNKILVNENAHLTDKCKHLEAINDWNERKLKSFEFNTKEVIIGDGRYRRSENLLESENQKEIDKLKSQIESAKYFWKGEVEHLKTEMSRLRSLNEQSEKKLKELAFRYEKAYYNGYTDGSKNTSEEFKRGYEQAQADFKYMQSSGKK